MPKFVIKVGDEYAVYSTIVDDIICHGTRRQIRNYFVWRAVKECLRDLSDTWQRLKTSDTSELYDPTPVNQLSGKCLKQLIKKHNGKASKPKI